MLNSALIDHLAGRASSAGFSTRFKDGLTMSLEFSQSRTGPNYWSRAGLLGASQVLGRRARRREKARRAGFGRRAIFRGGCAARVRALGILAMNIVGFGWPLPAYDNPFRGGGFEGLDRGVWFFNHMFFEAKMMTIFSMLFGAGLVLMDQRAEARGAKIRGVYFRRILWLLVIGLIHSYLIWEGDILVLYAQTGLFLYFFRNLTPRTLIILGISAMLILVPIGPGLWRRHRLHEGRDGPGRGPDQGGRKADLVSIGCSAKSGPSISATRSCPARAKSGQGMGRRDGGLSRQLPGNRQVSRPSRC